MNSLFDLDNAVYIQNQQVKTDSLKVAEIFGKNHRDVLRKLESLDCSPDFSERNFALAKYLDEQGKPRPMYDMTKDGFIFLVMGFTGEKAAQIKEAYIKAFNSMAVLLHNQQYTSQGLHYGAKVQLISGSPEFTVNQLIYDDEGFVQSVEVVCWNKNRLHKEILNIGSVIPVTGFHSIVLENFWTSVFSYGVDKLNHSKKPNLIALNLKQISQSIQGMPSRNEIAMLLMRSQNPYPKYVQHNYAVHSAITDKTSKCWLFDTTKPQHTIEFNA